MKKILDDVRRDAIRKSKAANTEDLHLLTDTAVYIDSLVKTRDLHGLSAMEQAVKDSPSEFFRSVCTFISDPYDLDDAIELVTNEYWSRDLQGVQAMTAYIYIRAALYISDPEHLLSDGFRYLLQSLLPPGSLRREFKELTERTYREMESRHEKEVSESFSHIIWPVFQDEEILENIHALEWVLGRLPDRDVQRLLRDMDMNTVSACICALGEDVRDRVIRNLSRRSGTTAKETAVQLHPISKKTASQSISNMLLVLGRLEASGEIRIL